MVDIVLLGQATEKVAMYFWSGWPLMAGMFIVPVVVVAVFISAISKKNRPPVSNKLAPCPDCFQSVSLRAQTCTHCGAPLKPSA